MSDWIEQYYQEQRQKQAEEAAGLDEKGGPGSGHWGHAGRPGQVGGSAPGKMGGSGRVNREYFVKGPGRDIIKSLDPEEQKVVIGRLTDMKIQARHLGGLKSIVTDVPPDDAWTDFHDDWTFTIRSTGQIGTAGGTYSPKRRTIHVPKSKLEKEPGIGTESGIYAGESHAFAHELGHHVTMKSPWSQSQGRIVLDKYYASLPAKFTVGGPEWDAGLRPYSFSNNQEFMADCWKVYQYGDELQRKSLANLVGVDSLDKLFGD